MFKGSFFFIGVKSVFAHMVCQISEYKYIQQMNSGICLSSHLSTLRWIFKSKFMWNLSPDIT